MDKFKLTSVKVLKDSYIRFRSICLDDDFTLQKLVNRAIDKYNQEENFRDEIRDYTQLHISSSKL